ncbi:30S ribosomal protein S9 [Candidatus Saccharibacteria bacterium]|nr:30S ribosomal protein S9 [Candidatus Saccharibacteria bacterium]
MTKENYYYALGRRKTASATARVFKGTGKITINGQELGKFFNNFQLEYIVYQPLNLISKGDSLDVTIKVQGGGSRGQAEAIRLAISKALVDMSEDFKSTLKKAGFLSRDPRTKERKKPGLRKARRAPQFSKR